MKNVGNITDPADRSYLWRTLADHVHLGKVKPIDFLNTVFDNIVTEKLEISIQMVLEKSFYMIKHFFDDEQRVEMRARMLQALLKKIEVTQDKSMLNLLA